MDAIKGPKDLTIIY